MPVTLVTTSSDLPLGKLDTIFVEIWHKLRHITHQQSTGIFVLFGGGGLKSSNFLTEKIPVFHLHFGIISVLG